MQKITPFLWFEDNAEDAVMFYLGAFKKTKITAKTVYDGESAAASGRPAGSVMTIGFNLEGQEFAAINGGPNFKFSPAVSFFIWCRTEKELLERWKRLSAKGKVLMKLGRYPFAKRYGWCMDRYGVSWQLILARNAQKITPALMFTQKQAGKAEKAMGFYTSLFNRSKIESIARDDEGKLVMHGRFVLSGQEFIAFDSPIPQKYSFTPAVSFVVNCRTQDEIDHFWGNLSRGGDKKAQQCGWLTDRYGVSWQVVPTILEDLLQGRYPERSREVMKALIKMKKLEIKKLKAAFQKGMRSRS